jgi:hypothetical protein
MVVGARNELTVSEIRRTRVVGSDNVHLTNGMNKNAAPALIYRLLERKPKDDGKRRRLE